MLSNSSDPARVVEVLGRQRHALAAEPGAHVVGQRVAGLDERCDRDVALGERGYASRAQRKPAKI
jgi:hypothetical protein